MALYVYEATNQNRKERFVGITHVPPQMLKVMYRYEHPDILDDWNFSDDKIRYNNLMETNSSSQADYFAWEFKRATPMPGWKLI